MKVQEQISSTLIQLEEIFKTTMGNNVTIDITTQKSDILEWDSLNHLNLIVELENTYNLGLSMEEIENLKTVKDIVDRINKQQ